MDNKTGDIEIVGDDPMILSWGAFLQLGNEGLNEYEQYRYPEPFHAFDFKAIWQRLRSIDAPEEVTIKSLLKREGNFEWSIKAFMSLVGCEVSFNVQEDILYLGSNDRDSVDKAVQRLDSVFKYRVSLRVRSCVGINGVDFSKKHAGTHPTHLILPPAGSFEWKICLRPISKFRLATSTIIQTNAMMAKYDYETLYTKGVISTYVFEDRYGDEWGHPECFSPDRAPPSRKLFVDFANYSYPAKQATSLNSSRNSVAESKSSKAVPRKTDPLVADWVRKLGEAHELRDQGHQSPTLQSPDGDLLDSGTHQFHGMGSPAELIQQGTSQEDKAIGDFIDTGGGITVRSTGSSSLKYARASILSPGSALVDLVGLSIPATAEVRSSSGSAEHVVPELRSYAPLVPSLNTNKNGHKNQPTGPNSNYTRDLLGMDDGDVLQDLMTPMVPTLTPQRMLPRLSPPREYHQTMNQKAPCRGRNRAQRRYNTAESLSPSPPPSPTNCRSKIPVKTRAPAPGARNAHLRGGFGLSGSGGAGAVQRSTAGRGSRLQEVWNTGLTGGAFGDFVLSPELRNSVKKRSYFKHALEQCLASMLNRARMIAGRVSMEIVFCRIVIENVNEDVVNFGRVEEEHPAFSPVRILNELALFREGDLRVHPTLSLDGTDADRLKEINWTSDRTRKWQQYDKAIFYDFSCEDLTSSCRFIIQVNATDFTHDFESQRFVLKDLVFIHCPDRSWDLNAYIKATDTAFFKDKYEDFAQSLVESLVVP